MSVTSVKVKNKKEKYWQYRCYYTNFYGKRVQKNSKLFKYKKEAEEEERKFLNEINEKNIDNKNFTLTDIHNIRYNVKKNDGVRYSTLKSYNDKFFHLKILSKIKLVDLNIQHINKWKEELNKTNLAVSTKNDILKYLKALLNYARDYHGFNFGDVYPKIKKFQDARQEIVDMDFYSLEEWEKYKENIEGIKWKCAFKFLYYCGLRRGELIALQWKDIDFMNKVVHITKKIPPHCNQQNWYFESPKSKRSIRTLPIADDLINDLHILFNNQQQYSNFNKNWFVLNEIVPLTRSSLYDENIRIAKRTGIRSIRIHDFRHSCSSLLINSGANVVLVSRYLGHSSIKETLDTYSHFFGNQLDEIALKINNITNIKT